MPACLTHYYFAKNVRENLPDASSLDACAYAWGAQGPDFFFCHRFLPFWRGRSLQEYGGRLHDETPYKVLGAMRDCTRLMQDISGNLRGKVAIGVTNGRANIMMKDIIARFHQSFPHVSISFCLSLIHS